MVFFEDATIELNNEYGWKRHNAQCQKNRPCSSNTDSSIFYSEQGIFNNRIESAEWLTVGNVLSIKYIDDLTPILYRRKRLDGIESKTVKPLYSNHSYKKNL